MPQPLYSAADQHPIAHRLGEAPTLTMSQLHSLDETAGYVEANGYNETIGYDDPAGYDEFNGYDETTAYETTAYENTAYDETAGYNETPSYHDTHGYEEAPGNGETTGYHENDGYHNTAAFDDVNVYHSSNAFQFIDAAAQTTSFEHGYIANPDYPDQFADTNHQQPNQYSHVLDFSENAAAEEPVPTISLSPSDYQSESISHPHQIIDQLIDYPQFQQSLRTSPWDAVAPTASPATLTPDYLNGNPSYSRPSSTATRSQADVDAQRYLSYLAPSTDDGASTYSGLTDSSSTSCHVCRREFGNARQLRRHQNEVHRGIHDPQYVCKCDYHATRKANYIRHLINTCRSRDNPDLVFVCICREPSNDFNVHLEHIQACGRLPAGRRPNNARRV